ncbi:MAG: FAD-dependent oxidoreductase [Bulleidia sp.]
MKKLCSVFLSAVMAFSLGACGTPSASKDATPSAVASGYKAGTYTASAAGRNGDVTVSVTFSDEAITDVKVTDQKETPVIGDAAITRIPEDIVKYQSLGVDTVSGATFTSRAILNAVGDAVDQAGGNSEALAKVTCDYPALATDDVDTDVLVIGGGTAGLMAAYTASAAGKKVTVVEKLDVIGGTLNEAAGLLLTVNSENNDASLDDSLDRVVQFYKKVNETSSVQPDYEFTANLMKQTGQTIDELIDLGMDHTDLDMGNYVGTIFTAGYKLSADLQGLCEKNGVNFLTGTKALQLLQNDEGAITGAKVENRSGSFAINAKKVIVAAGGASWSEDLKQAEPELSTVDLHEKTQIGSTADGMHMLQEVGAQMADTLYVKSSQPDLAPIFKNDWSNTPDTGMTLMIDADGKRFANEAPAAATILNKQMINHGSKAYWNILDGNNTIGFDADYFEVVKQNAEQGDKAIAVYAKTLDELADKLGVSKDTLKETVAAYNEACKAGTDAQFGKDASYLKELPEDGGYYAVYRREGSWGTIGGAIVDKQQHVLKEDGSILPGVYAAGETATAQLFGEWYFGGFSLGMYMTAGRIAAENAVQEMQ